MSSSHRQFPLSLQQESVLASAMHEPDAFFNPRHTVFAVLRVRGALDVGVLRAATGDLVRKHSLLRTKIVEGPSGDAVQEELTECEPVFVEEALAADEIAARCAALSTREIPWDQPPAVRVEVHTIDGADRLLYLGIHHLACDAVGLQLALADLARAYESRIRGEPSAASELSYGEYASWQRTQAATTAGADELFWKEHLAGLEPYQVRTDFPFRPHQPRGVGSERRSLALASEAALELPRFALRHRTTPLVVLLSAFQIVLSARTRSADRLTTSYFDRRDHPATRAMVGYFLFPTAVRGRVETTERAGDSFKALTRATLSAHEHSRVPIHQLLDAFPEAMPALVGEAAPWFFHFQYLPRAETTRLRFGQAQAEVIHGGANNHQDPGLSLRLRPDEHKGLLLRIGFDPLLWSDDSMAALSAAYAAVLRRILERPELTCQQLLEECGTW
jgi:hypothetical protein